MDATTITSVIAIVVSAISAGLTAFSYFKDRSRVIAWTEVTYDRSQDYENPPPCFYLKIVNTGRRPIVLTDIEKIGPKGCWSNPLAEPQLEGSLNTILQQKKFKDIFSVKNTSKVLQEAGFFEVSYEVDRFFSEVFSIEGDEVIEATDFFIIDILGNKYPVKNARKHIAEMLAHKPSETTGLEQTSLHT